MSNLKMTSANNSYPPSLWILLLALILFLFVYILGKY